MNKSVERSCRWDEISHNLPAEASGAIEKPSVKSEEMFDLAIPCRKINLHVLLIGSNNIESLIVRNGCA